MKSSFFAILVLLSLVFSAAAPAARAETTQGLAAQAVALDSPAHPILDSKPVRQAIAYCMDKNALIAAAYPALSQAERDALYLDTLFPKSHWAYTEPTVKYPYNPAQGIALLEGAGWTLAPGDVYRTKAGRELSLTLNTTGAALRQAYAPVLKQQLAACGIRLVIGRMDAAWLFGPETGLARRDFELASFAWIRPLDEVDTQQLFLYGCDFIPSAANGWTGQNYMGWCNPAADDLNALGDNTTLDQATRKANYAAAMEIMLEELPSIPLFQRGDDPAGVEHLDLNLDLTATSPTPQSHPILKSQAVRQAIAYCMDKNALIAAAYPALSQAERDALYLDTLFPKSHWAYTEPTVKYPYNPAQGIALLEGAGWTLAQGATYRTKAGRELALTLNTTGAALRQAYVPVLTGQLAACGIRLVTGRMDAAWLFGTETGLARRDFELASFAWIRPLDEVDTQQLFLYGCGFIPSVGNNWTGQNYMGWCNPAADSLNVMGDDTALDQDTRKGYYSEALETMLSELPSIPLFQRGDDPAAVEHLDFNLDTFKQATTIDGSAEVVIPVAAYDGYGTISVPAGAVNEVVDLVFTPLDSATQPAEAGTSALVGFQLTAEAGGLPVDGFTFDLPVRVSLTYSDGILANIDESSLRLYLWDGAAWQDASLSCPVADRYFALNIDLNKLEVNVCHLTEFSLTGDNQYLIRLPFVRR